MAKIKKNNRVAFWVTDGEKATLKAKVLEAGLSISEFLRQSVVKTKIAAHNRQILYEINKAGCNINQISRHCNAKKTIDLAVLKELMVIEALLRNSL